MTALLLDQIPEALRATPRWRAWYVKPRRNSDKVDKVPAGGASTADPSQWGEFAAAVEEQRRGGFAGVGLCNTGLNGVIGLDFDNVVTDGAIAPWAAAIIRACNSYAEVSPSGRGIRVFVRGALPGGDLINHDQGFEAYTGASPRFLTVTGNRLQGVPADLGELAPEAVALIEGYRTRPAANGSAPAVQDWVWAGKLDTVDAETIADLRSALRGMADVRADHREQWIDVLMALASLKATAFAADAYSLAYEFSARCPAKFDPDDLAKRWHGLQPGKITHRSIFRWAAEDGWQNPRAATDAEPPAATSAFFPASELAGTPPARAWLCEGLIPSHTVTLLNGDGGVGKSLLALQLAVAVVAGRNWLARDVAHGPAVFITAEDDRGEIHRRIATIAGQNQIPMPALNSLTLRSLAGEDALLATLNQGRLSPTPLFGEIDACMMLERPALVVLDTLADLFPGNENDRAQARHFIGLLRGLAIRHGCAVVLLAHPSLTGLNSGSGTSGSTAWNNSVRSRLYLDRVKVDGDELDPDARRLTTMKANYGRTGDEILMSWRAGLFVADHVEADNGALRTLRAQRVFLKLLREFTDQGRYVSANGGPTYAPKLFAEHPASEGCTKRIFKMAMEQLLATKTIIIAEHGVGSKIRSHIAISNPRPTPFLPFQPPSNVGGNPLPTPFQQGEQQTPHTPQGLAPALGAGPPLPVPDKN